MERLGMFPRMPRLLPLGNEKVSKDSSQVQTVVVAHINMSSLHMEAYNVTKLQWEPLGKFLSPASDFVSTLPDSVDEYLSSKPWLLSEGQSIPLPKSHIEKCTERIFSVSSFVRYVENAAEKDVFASAVDDAGKLHDLSPQQMQDILRTGQLTVPSKSFENQVHVWRVNRGFYSGTETNRQLLREGTGKALDHLIVYTQEAATLVSENWLQNPSWLGSVTRGFLRAVRLVADAVKQLFLGTPKPSKYTPHTINIILNEAELGFVQEELRKRGLDTGLLRSLLDGGRVMPETVKEIWNILVYEFSWGASCRRNVADVEKLSQDSKTVERWHQSFLQELEARRKVELPIDMQNSLVSPAEAREEAERAKRSWRDSADDKWIEELITNSSHDKRLAMLEANRQRALLIEANLQKEDDLTIETQKQEQVRLLMEKYPVLSLSEAWRNRKISHWESAERAVLAASRIERCLEILREQDLHDEATVRELRINFQEKHRESLGLALAETKIIFPPASFDIVQLNPNYGHRTKKVEVDVDKPFWRVKHMWLTCVQATKSILVSSWSFVTAGPLSLRALFAQHAYYAIEGSTINASSYTPTLRSRLESFWNELASVRERFERSPDTGLIGKSIQRFFFQVYLTLKGATGTALISSVMVLGVTIATIAGALLIATAPILGVMTAVLISFVNVFIYDFAFAAACDRLIRTSYRTNLLSCCRSDLPSAVSPIMKLCFGFPYLALFPGAGQAMLASIRVLLWHPVIGAIMFSSSAVRWCLRSVRDSCTSTLVKRYGRVPASDTFLASRISGPGVGQSYFYRMPLNAAKTNLWMLLDVIRLEAHSQIRAIELDAPSIEYEKVFRNLCGPFFVTTNLAFPRPSHLARAILSKIKMNKMPRDSCYESEVSSERTRSGVWDAIAQRIRSMHPDFESQLSINGLQTWENQSSKHKRTIDELEDEARLAVLHQVHFTFVVDNEKLRQMVTRPAILMATWTLQAEIRDDRHMYLVSMPPHVRNQFRLSAEDLQELWTFAMLSVQQFSQMLFSELSEIATQSNYPAELLSAVKEVYDSIWTNAGARPDKDIATVAAWLLSELFGGDVFLQSLEETDQSFVLIPKSIDDSHLVFW